MSGSPISRVLARLTRGLEGWCGTAGRELAAYLTGNRASNVTESNASGVTLTAAQIINTVIARSGPASTFTDTTPTAAQIVAAMPGCDDDEHFEFWIKNTGGDVLTLAAGTGVTLALSTTVAANFLRHYRGVIDNATEGAEAVTITGLEISPATGQTLTLNGGGSLPLTTERNSSSYHWNARRAGADKGGFSVTATHYTMVGFGGNGLGFGLATSSSTSTTVYWTLDPTTPFAFRPNTDNVYDLGTSAARVANTYSRQFRPGAGAVIWTSGAGTPEGAITAPVGSLYTRTDGGANTTLYVKESGAGNTGWVAK